jgi:type IV pilus assembly protein PilA
MKQKAFTLIELLVVVAIIGILAAVGVVAYNGYTGATKERTTLSNFSIVVNYIHTEVMKCGLGESKVMGGKLPCYPKPATGGVRSKTMEVFRTVYVLKNSYQPNQFAVDNGNNFARDEDVGFIRLNITSGAKQYLKVKTCFKTPCSDTSNHKEEMIISDMISP